MIFEEVRKGIAEGRILLLPCDRKSGFKTKVVLALQNEKEPITASDLADKLNIKRKTIYNLLRRAEKADLVQAILLPNSLKHYFVLKEKIRALK